LWKPVSEGLRVSESDDLRAENLILQARLSALETDLANRARVDRTPMLALVDALPLLVATVSAAGAAEFFSAAFMPWLAMDRADALGRQMPDVLIPSLRGVAMELKAEVAGGQMLRREITVPDATGAEHYLLVTIVPRRLSGMEPNGWVWVIQDQTAQRQADAALRASEQRLSLATEAAGLGVWDRDLATGALVYSDQAKAIYGFPLDQAVTYEMVIAHTHPDDFAPSVAMYQRATDPALKENIPYEFRITRADGALRWIEAHGEAIFETRDGVEVATRYVGTIQDVTEATLAAQRQTFLMHELNHRVKNTLASVQSIAHLTLRAGRNLVDIREQLTARLVALAGAHDILTRENWEAANLADIVAAAIEPYDAPSSRFRIEGPTVRIAPKAAVALALALHELVTNALKYGALSVDGGWVTIAWRLEIGAAETLVLDWRERGGPPVAPPTRTGFGMRLLEHGLVTEFGGEAQLTFEPEGLVCRIQAPLGAHAMLELG
jgi:PAS domain S-box-containing protein